MAESPYTGRLVSFTLADVPLAIRRRAGAPLLKKASDDADLMAAVTLKRAIENPSGTVYRVPEDAWRQVVAGR